MASNLIALRYRDQLTSNLLESHSRYLLVFNLFDEIVLSHLFYLTGIYCSSFQILLNDKLLQSNDSKDAEKFGLDHKIANGENSRDGGNKSCAC